MPDRRRSIATLVIHDSLMMLLFLELEAYSNSAFQARWLCRGGAVLATVFR
jgi:hypothetical protein